MNYIRSVLKLEDKFRVYAIILIAAAIMALAVIDGYQDRKNEEHHHKVHAAQHM